MNATTLARPVRLWTFYGLLFHYRLPFWDRLIARSRGRFELTAFGMMDHGQAFGGGSRPYLQHMDVGGGLPSVGYTFHGAHEKVRRDKPEVVMIQPNPRNRLSWQLPDLCRSYGGVSVLWSKIHSKSRYPTWALDALKRRLYPRYDLAFTYGPSSTQELVGLGFPPDRIFTAYNTIDTDHILTDREGIRLRAAALRQAHGHAGKTILLCIAKFEPQKRHSDLLAAWPRLRELDPSLVLLLAGRGSLSEQVREQARRLDPERIQFLGSLPEGVDYDWIAAANATIQCGAVGLAINQSMALGTPAIIADEPGADAEILQHGVTGWRYEKGNIDALVRNVEDVLRDEKQRARITAEAQRFVREEANIASMVDRAEACIEMAIDLWHKRNGAS